MLVGISWRFGERTSPRWPCPIRLGQDEQGIVVLSLVGANDDGTDCDLPLAFGLVEGVYEASSLHNWLHRDYCNLEVVSAEELDQPTLEAPPTWWDTYGVADTVDQVIAHFQAQIADPAHCYVIYVIYVIAVLPIAKSDQPPTNGWRWDTRDPTSAASTGPVPNILPMSQTLTTCCFTRSSRYRLPRPHLIANRTRRERHRHRERPPASYG